MAKTTNINLNIIPADDDMNFIDFRTQVAGTGAESNMVIIDEQIQLLKDGKVAKIPNMGLSSNNFDDTLKNKLDNIEENANNYTLPVAKTDTLGGVKIGANLSVQADGTLNADGDMLKSAYDTNNNGKVDRAELADEATHAETADNATNATHADTADNATQATNATNATNAINATNATNADNADTVNNLTVETAVPVGAVFTDTTYVNATDTEDGLMSSEDKAKIDSIVVGNATSIQGKPVSDLAPVDGQTLVYSEAENKYIPIDGNFGSANIPMTKLNILRVELTDNGVLLKWKDPDDLRLQGVNLSKWSKTEVYRKVGSTYESETDGELILTNTTKNQYAETGYEDLNKTPEKVYYRFVPYNTNGEPVFLEEYIIESERGHRLEDYTWAEISEFSRLGVAKDMFKVGDRKTITLSAGMLGLQTYVESSHQVVLIGHNHNEQYEGKGMHFCMFAKNDMLQSYHQVTAFRGSYYNQGRSSAGYLNINITNSNVGGWKGSSNLRTAILGGAEVVGEDATGDCLINPAEGTLMALIPSDLRSVLKPMTKYSNNTGYIGAPGAETDEMLDEATTPSIEYLTIPSAVEFVKDSSLTSSIYISKLKQVPYEYILNSVDSNWYYFNYSTGAGVLAATYISLRDSNYAGSTTFYKSYSPVSSPSSQSGYTVSGMLVLFKV